MPRLCKLTFDLLTLKVVSESCLKWATSVTILVFLGLSVLDLGPCTRQTNRRQTDIRRPTSLNASALWRRGITNVREAARICPAACTLTSDVLTLKVVSETCVTWATSVPILVFLYRPICSRLRPDVLDRQIDVRRQTDKRQTRIIA